MPLRIYKTEMPSKAEGARRTPIAKNRGRNHTFASLFSIPLIIDDLRYGLEYTLRSGLQNAYVKISR